jgi:crotonobetainyl-CoA:carnitine CoA-transferase CaiB-like acyl-CoA transferase
MNSQETAKGSQNLPLAGLRVVEFSQYVMAPTAGMILADLGAEVIKLEPTPGGDPTRNLTSFASGFFGFFNRNKLSVAVDLKRPEGVKLVHRLMATADIGLDNFAPGTIERLGCAPEDLCKLNPRLIYCSLKGFLTGPYENRTAFDEVVQFMGGMAYMTGPAGRPLRAGSSVVDLMGGVMGVVGILAALRERDKTGKGQIVKSGLFETTAFMMGQHMAASIATGQRTVPMPERVNPFSIYEVFKTKSGDGVFIAVTSDNHWRRFCSAFGRTDLLEDARLATNEKRCAARPWMFPIISDMICALPKSEVMRLCEEATVPFAPVAKVEDLFDDPHLNQSGALLDVIVNGVSGKLPRLPITIGDHDLGLRRNAPEFGHDTTEILQSAGVDIDEIEDLRRKGILI